MTIKLESSLCIVLAAVILAFSSLNAAEKIVGYGFSDAVFPAKNQEMFYMGFECGFEEILGKGAVRKYVMTEKVTDGSQMGAVKAATKLIKDTDIALIVGFPTSHEALLAAPVAKSAGLLSIYAGAGHSDLAKFGDLVFTIHGL